MRQNTLNYQQAGGEACFSDYYTARYESAIMDPALARHMVFAQHNLATDSSLGEMDLIVCRNVLIYFNRALQDRAIGLFAESLPEGGVLCLGSRESVRFCCHAGRFEELMPPAGTAVSRPRPGSDPAAPHQSRESAPPVPAFRVRTA